MNHFWKKTLCKIAVATMLVGAGMAQAQVQAIWHCSRAPESASLTQAAAAGDSFQLASGGLNSEAIGISVVDLLDIYSNKSIQINGRPVTACFMPGESEISNQALNLLGLKASSMQLQARKSAIVRSNLRLVTDEVEMLSCIAKNYPAVGYLSQEIQGGQVVPCF